MLKVRFEGKPKSLTMCRLVGFLSQLPIFAKEVLIVPENSLICQSKHAKSGLSGVNADGFGIGWYDFAVDECPSTFKSILPAWNDKNLLSLASKLKTQAFLGHVRASTVGDVAVFNCHPFEFENMLFAHNGTIKDFHLIKQKMLSLLSPQAFSIIKGQTDSECFFALIYHFLDKSKPFIEAAPVAIQMAIQKINELKAELPSSEYTRLNFILINGKALIAVRYSNPSHIQPLTMHYMADEKKVTVASEPLNEFYDTWDEIPQNHFFIAENHLKFSLFPVL